MKNNSKQLQRKTKQLKTHKHILVKCKQLRLKMTRDKLRRRELSKDDKDVQTC